MILTAPLLLLVPQFESGTAPDFETRRVTASSTSADDGTESASAVAEA